LLVPAGAVLRAGESPAFDPNPLPVNPDQNIRIEIANGFHLGLVRRGDEPALLDHFADPEIGKNLLALPFPYTAADADWWVRHCEEHLNQEQTTFALRSPTGYLIGGIGIVGTWAPGDHCAEFGYWLASSFRGLGLMAHTIRSFSDHAFQRLGVHRLYATPFPFNRASHRALEKAGFEREGVLRDHHRKQGAYIDAIVYGRLADSVAKAETPASSEHQASPLR
jgi:ribosomal-protein-alanine N-acetyltransferase